MESIKGEETAASEWLTEAAAAKFLHVSPASLRKWRSAGRCTAKINTTPPCSACGGRYLYNKRALNDWLVEMSVKSAAANNQ